MKNRILVIEDDTAISELISMNLTVAGYDTEALFDGNEGRMKVLDAVQDAVDNAIAEEDAWLASQE